MEVKRILGFYRERYRGWNVRHFHQTLRREHGVTVSYTFVKEALQEAGLVARQRARGRHRRRRERKACLGEMLHIDGSKHAWLPVAGEKQTIITVVDDATSRLLYAQLWKEESTQAVLAAVRHVVETALEQLQQVFTRGAGAARHRFVCPCRQNSTIHGRLTRLKCTSPELLQLG